MTDLHMHTYKGYEITIREQNPPVAVFDPRFPRRAAIYRTTSLDLAMRFVDAYRDGRHWADEAVLSD